MSYKTMDYFIFVKQAFDFTLQRNSNSIFIAN